jgi:hypothetical protein
MTTPHGGKVAGDMVSAACTVSGRSPFGSRRTVLEVDRDGATYRQEAAEKARWRGQGRRAPRTVKKVGVAKHGHTVPRCLWPDPDVSSRSSSS